ncbi:glycoside hydrolase family 3 N-terminal domain-containing protein [Actinomyces culturomici]|uniref:glycoside hydrolase family 3 N-terminal domain-containing protein n=1 Tax=Actinomyces culturomici TaxID=1926276 RepID=UPI000E2061AF|nr:glycoside hydrolase family 3 N-terminal domain-containing protein [Actinomyces culturomici]
MLTINWEDVARIAISVKGQLIAIGAILLLAIVVTVAVREMNAPARKLTRSTTWIAALAAIAVAVVSMLYGGFKTVLDLASGDGRLSSTTEDAAARLGEEIANEGIVVLKNTERTLPLEKGAPLNVFGWASSNPVYGGTGSGSISDQYPTVSLIDGLENAGFTTNHALTSFYTSYRSDRPVISMFGVTDWTLPEPPVATYDADLRATIESFSRTAIVTIARSGGEGYDLPQDVPGEVAEIGPFSYTENSASYQDFDKGQGYLSLTHSEKDMIALAEDSADRVVVVYNGSNAFQLGELQDDPKIDAIVWAIPGGQVGFNALGRILDGELNPSAKTPDTFVRDLTRTPTANNFGRFLYTNMDEFKQYAAFSNEEAIPSFVDYVEGIYVGYRWWETAAAEGVVDYDEQVVYPFGYGLSYTSFEQEMGDVSYSDGVVSFDVTVTNTGDVAGKDVVEAYYNPPYTNGGIEKAAANLVAYEKTDLLQPGVSQTVTISFNDDDMASYDSKTAKAWVLEAGDYKVSIRANSHEIIDEKDVNVAEKITYNTADSTHNGDAVPATNEFDSANDGLEYLSRADKFANYAEATAAPASMELSDADKATFIANQNYDPTSDDDESADATMPTTGAKNGLVLGDMYGLAYDDPKWDELLDQLTVDDMSTLSAHAGYGTPEIDSIGKRRMTDLDGPAAVNNPFTKVGSIGLPTSVAIAASFNRQLAERFGTTIGAMAHDMNVAGWYAPAVNAHRSAYGGRNFEYFSEDPLLTGTMAASEIAAVQAVGVYAFVKHFALNDQETNRSRMLMTWSNEQAIREIYLRPFEIAVKEGGATAVMSAYNYVGTVYAGATPALLQTVLRDEWGFRGMVLTDYFAGFGYQNADQIVRNGGDAMLATIDVGTNRVTALSPAAVSALREAAHNILYTTANSWLNDPTAASRGPARWEYAAWGALLLLAFGLVRWETKSIRGFLNARSKDSA